VARILPSELVTASPDLRKALSLYMAPVRACNPVVSGGTMGEEPPGMAGERSSPAGAADASLAALPSSSTAATCETTMTAGTNSAQR
jgi:hypothetical protein